MGFRLDVSLSCDSPYIFREEGVCQTPSFLISAIINMNVAGKIKAVEELWPSQREIDLKKSFEHLFQEEDYSKFFNREPVILGDPIVTFGEESIVDGHHRWAEAFLANPNCQMEILDFSNDEAVGEDQNVFEFIDRFDGVKASGEKVRMNAYDFKEKKLREWLFKNLPDSLKTYLCQNKIVDDDKDWGSMDVGKIVAVDYLLQNAKKLSEHRAPKGAPKRVEMPQLTETTEEEINRLLEE